MLNEFLTYTWRQRTAIVKVALPWSQTDVYPVLTQFTEYQKLILILPKELQQLVCQQFCYGSKIFLLLHDKNHILPGSQQLKQMYIRLPQVREMNKRKNTNIALHTYARHLASYRYIRERQESERRGAKMKLALSFMLLYAGLVCVTPYKIQKVRHKT